MVPLSFAGQLFQIVAPAALYWPDREAVIVADLHLEKASFYARQGQMLPPYDSRATLDELATIISRMPTRRIFCLGDNYHDEDGERRLEPQSAKALSGFTAQIEWFWITGNHDPSVRGRWGGAVLDEWTGSGLALRHEATADSSLPEISGHFHPKLRVPVRGRHVSRRCFVKGARHLIMPAFGSLTGGMSAADPVIEQLVGGPAEAIMGLSNRPVHFPLPFAVRDDTQSRQQQLPLTLADD